MSQLTDILMIGLVLVGGYYALSYMGQGTTTGQSLAPVPTSTTVNVPFDQVATLWETPALREQECANWRTSDENPAWPCTNECGKNGNGEKCNKCEAACNQANQYVKEYVEGEIEIPDTDRCATLWKNSCATACGPNGSKFNCEKCEDDCGDRWTDQYPGQRTVNHRALCQGQGGVWNGTCCDCMNKRMSQVQCCSGTMGAAPKPKPKPPAMPASRFKGKTTVAKKVPPRAITPAKPKPKPKMSANEGLCISEGGKWQGSCCSCPNKLCKNKCKSAGYASTYLGSAFSRWGPGYTYRDNFADPYIMQRMVPGSPDFEYLSAKKPYYLGPISPERAVLNKRFFANMAITIA